MASQSSLRSSYLTSERLSIANHYALEVLESSGNISPSQIEIDLVERLLKKESNNFNNIKKSPLYLKDRQAMGKALLIEEQSLHARAHLMLLNNIGFEVEHVYDYRYYSSKTISSNDVIMVGNDPAQLNICKYIKDLIKIKGNAKVLLMTEKNTVNEELVQLLSEQNISAIVVKPTIYHQMRRALKSVGLVRDMCELISNENFKKP